MTPTKTAAVGLHDAAALWSVGHRGAAQNVVRVACDALVAGLDSPTLGILAALTANEADLEVPELLPIVLDELGLPPLPRDSVAGHASTTLPDNPATTLTMSPSASITSLPLPVVLCALLLPARGPR
ncbi:hypothetical protein KGQ20_16815 [Catenulispora sp. NF23]|uniref:Uncharacterized protein n=1 Tax=Catenulispora pinistramenti TaxID=2705254 RepID=A0ABS5KWC4_9ACTN|nr:hypothetical protein [Catenulispora pinistramenti]MBS2534435.1 hypothetical protein [Catenulispora pinistramenti]MBS2550370.1 hypothetical protein [Catenulispora pinistramenti]